MTQVASVAAKINLENFHRGSFWIVVQVRKRYAEVMDAIAVWSRKDLRHSSPAVLRKSVPFGTAPGRKSSSRSTFLNLRKAQFCPGASCINSATGHSHLSINPVEAAVVVKHDAIRNSVRMRRSILFGYVTSGWRNGA